MAPDAKSLEKDFVLPQPPNPQTAHQKWVEKAVKIVSRVERKRGKHFTPKQAEEFREMLERVSEWGGW